MAALKALVFMRTSTLVRLVFGLLTSAIMARLLGLLELNPLISVFYGKARLVRVVTRKSDACRQISGRKCFIVLLHPMTAEIA